MADDVAVAPAAIDTRFWGSVALLILAGLAMSVSNVSANSLLQSTTGERMRGRTVSLYICSRCAAACRPGA